MHWLFFLSSVASSICFSVNAGNNYLLQKCLLNTVASLQKLQGKLQYNEVYKPNADAEITFGLQQRRLTYLDTDDLIAHFNMGVVKFLRFSQQVSYYTF